MVRFMIERVRSFIKMNKEQLFEFCKEWLKAWTGNEPEKLMSFYQENALYSDPQHRAGLQSHDEILPYFKKLLATYQDWSWRPIEVFPIEKGCILKWECTIPVGNVVINETGLDIVEIEDGKIKRNEVYFDRTRLIKAVEELKRQERLIS